MSAPDRSWMLWTAAEDEALRGGARVVAGRTRGACEQRRRRLGLCQPVRPAPPPPALSYTERQALEDLARLRAALQRAAAAVWAEKRAAGRGAA